MEFNSGALRKFLYLTIGAIIYSVFFEFFYCWMRFGNPMPFPLGEMGLSTLYNFVPIYLLVFINYGLIFRYTKGKRPIISAIYCLLISTALLIGISWLFIIVTGYPVDYAGTIFCNLLILAGLESIYYAAYSKEILRQRAMKEQEALMYRYEALKAQINPHFLFNSLNILYSFIPASLSDAREYVLNLSRIYRYTLNHNDKSEVSVRTELDFLNSYVKILRIRFMENLNVDISGVSEQADRKIIPYSLQMLVENVTKHNVISTDNPITIQITLDNEGITVTNPIHPKDCDTSGTKFGLSYLKHLYAFHGRIFRTENDGLRFTAFLPYIP